MEAIWMLVKRANGFYRIDLTLVIKTSVEPNHIRIGPIYIVILKFADVVLNGR